MSRSLQSYLQNLKNTLVEGNAEDSEMDVQFHTVLMELFLWKEYHKLLEVLECPVQHFLVYASVKKDAKGFISACEIERLYAKLIIALDTVFT